MHIKKPFRLLRINCWPVCTAIALFVVVVSVPQCVATGLTIDASEDAVFRGGANSNTTFSGAALEINASNDGSGGDTSSSAKSWLKFDLNNFSSFSALSGATLQIAPGTGTGAPINVYGLTGIDSWNDTSTTWNTAPGNDTASAVNLLPGNVFGGAPLGSFTHASGSISFTSNLLSDYLDSQRAINGGDDTATLILTGALPIAGNSNGFFKSIESDPGEEARLSLSIDSPLELRVNRFSGLTQIVGVNTPGSFEIDGYTIGSGTELALDPTGWNSLQDQAEAGWEEVPPGGGADPRSSLTELNLTGSRQIANGEVVSLGQAYDASTSFEDLTFSYTVAGNTDMHNGNVVFTYDGGLYAQVNKLTGRITIINPAPTDIVFDAYGIQSTIGLLDPASWDSLHDQSETGWVESNSSANQLLELNLDSSTLLPAGESIDLGTGYTGGLEGTEELTFMFSLNGGPIVPSHVEYFLPGDFDNDGKVDSLDLIQWQGDYGLNGDSDADGDGDSDGNDFLIWQSTFGAGTGSLVASTQVVPEPCHATLLGIGLGVLAFMRRKRARE